MRIFGRMLLVVLLALAVSACADGDTPVSDGGGAEPTDPPAGPGGAQPITPEPGVGNNVRARQFDRAVIDAQDHSIEVFFYGGVEECYVLDRVDVERPDPHTVALTLHDGGRPGARVCPEIAVSYVTTVELEEPLAAGSRVVDGSDGQVKS
jgi:hypothetical protein